MAGHTATANFTSVDQVEGCRVTEALLDELWPNATPAEIATGLRKALETGLWINLVASGLAFDAAAQLADSGTPDIH